MGSLDSRLLYVKELRHFSAVCLSFETACNWQTEALASVIFLRILILFMEIALVIGFFLDTALFLFYFCCFVS